MALGELILNAYDELTTRPGGTVRLAEIRRRLPGDWTSERVSSLLLWMDDRRIIQLEADPDRMGLTADDRAAAVQLSGRDRHLMRRVQR